MELFGVQELPNSKSISAPGWGYVADTGVNASVSALKPSSRKRAARNLPTSGHDNTAKQDAKVLRELAALDKEGNKDVHIPVPVKHRDNAGRVTHGKVTPAVRKILQSQKNFANHLSDAEALAALQPSQPPTQAPSFPRPRSPASRASPASTATPISHTAGGSKRSGKRKEILLKEEPSNADVVMVDAPPPETNLLPLSQDLTPHPGDNDPLLKSRIPPVPTAAVLVDLLAAPPLTYTEARAKLSEEDLRRPVRSFCEICGYWGRVKCMKCGSKVCALECLRTHQEDCFTRYGA